MYRKVFGNKRIKQIFRLVTHPVFSSDDHVLSVERWVQRIVGDMSPVNRAGLCDKGHTGILGNHAAGGGNTVGLADGAG